MATTKLITPAEGRGLIVGNRESRKVRLLVEFEGSCPVVSGERKVERLRDAQGRWVRAVTIVRRLEQLGATVVNFDIGEPGPHTPNY